MIFSKEMLRAVLDGRKTVTRRPVKKGKAGAPFEPCRYRVGSDYAIQAGYGQRGIGERFEVTDVARGKVGEIDYAGARAEGFKTTAEFRAHWLLLHDKAWLAKQSIECPACDGKGHLRPPPDVVYCPACEASGDMTGVASTEVAEARFADRHGEKNVWVITFRLLHAPRSLAHGGDDSGLRYRVTSTGRHQAVEHLDDRDSDRGYTSAARSAMRDEPEAVDDALLKIYSADAAERFAGQPGRRAEELRQRAKGLAQLLRAGDFTGLTAQEVHEHLNAIAEHLKVLDEQRRPAGRAA